MGLTAGLLLAISIVSGSFPSDPPRSACNKTTQGHYWPEQANTDRKLAGRLMRTGELQMCSRGFFRYRWKPLTISYQSLLAERKGGSRRASVSAIRTDVDAR